MSSFEDLVKKYVDEIADFVPLSGALSFVLGVVVVSGAGNGLGVWHVLTRDFGDYWFFRDIVFKIENWKLLVLAFISLSSSLLVKRLARIFVSHGMAHIAEEVGGLFKRAGAIAQADGFPASLMEAASQWKSVRSAAVLKIYKMGSFFVALSAIALFSFVLTFNLFDLLCFLLMLGVGVFLSWRFSLRFISGYLPERILRDAGLGLVEPRILEDV